MTGQDGAPVLKRNNLFSTTYFSCLYLIVDAKVNNIIRIYKENQLIISENFPYYK